MRLRAIVRIALALLGAGFATISHAADPTWPKSLTVGTASPGGVYYPYGEGMAQILTGALGIPVNPLPTQGPVHNVKLVESGGVQIGLITMGVGLQGWNGAGDWTGGKQFRVMRALFPMYDTPFHAMVLRKSGITAMGQLANKRVGVGPRAGTGGTYIPAIFKILGISADISFGAIGDQAAELSDGRIDAAVNFTGVPIPAWQKVEAKEPVSFVRLSPDEIAAVRKALPEFSPSTIHAGTYKSLDKDYETIGVYNFAVGRADLPDDLVYQLVKAIYENQPRLVKAHSSAKETLPQNVDKDTFLPFHPGAVRFYREKGIKIPDMLAQTN